jgi:tRNA1Val (adenine37-N6)-methyltransferase
VLSGDRSQLKNEATMPNPYFTFKQFTVRQEHCAMKVTTDACVLGAWFAAKLRDHTYVLDLGSGTGLLALMLAQKLRSEIHGIEIDLEAFRQLKDNVDHCTWKDKIRVMIGDARSYRFPVKYDFIISNPPFYENQLESPDGKLNLARHSSSLSLRELFTVIRANLTTDGAAGLLMPFDREEECIAVAREQGFQLSELLRVKQTPKHGWFRTILQFTPFPSGPVVENELVIRDGQDQYTPEFTELLKDYYLKF